VWSVSRPANDVGGDLVDYIELDGFRHGILLGDVAGKGLGAALLTAKLQATLRALVPDVASLDDLGARVNDIFHRDGLDNRYATLFFAELEHHSGHLRYLNAGHNPAFVVRADRIEKLSASSYPLGMLAEASYEEGALSLAPGDVMLAYSDGLTEANNAAGDEFGVERLEKLLPELRDLSPQEIGSRVLSHVDRFLGDTRLNDDLSLAIIVKR
jgi:sigma-B regulation protein RsbU (phosphoserine phosphatase)